MFAKTMKELVANSAEYRKYADGDIWALFNKANVDNKMTKGQTSFVVDFYTAMRIKKAGQAAIMQKLNSRLLIKSILTYLQTLTGKSKIKKLLWHFLLDRECHICYKYFIKENNYVYRS